MKTYSYVELENEFKGFGYQWPTLHLIGVRSKANEKNKFDDYFYLVNGPIMFRFTCTTNPGTHWLKNLMNPKGTAVLKPGQYVDSWKLGLHQGKYEALKQAKNVKVYRDANKDLSYDENKVDEGLFGINIHKAGADSTYVENWSEGCQVFKRSADFEEFMKICRKAREKHGNSFTYTLIESSDIK